MRQTDRLETINASFVIDCSAASWCAVKQIGISVRSSAAVGYRLEVTDRAKAVVWEEGRYSKKKGVSYFFFFFVFAQAFPTSNVRTRVKISNHSLI